MFKVTVMQMIDFDAQGDKSHTSISGGIATHSFDKIHEFKEDTLENVIKTITINYGTPYIFEDRLELQINDYTSYSFYIEEVMIKAFTHAKLKKQFGHLENLS